MMLLCTTYHGKFGIYVQIITQVITIPPYIVQSIAEELSEDNKSTPKVWSLDSADMLDDDLELVDEDDLLNEEDLKKPDPASLRGNQPYDSFYCTVTLEKTYNIIIIYMA